MTNSYSKCFAYVYFILIILNLFLFCFNTPDCSSTYCLSDGFNCIDASLENHCDFNCRPSKYFGKCFDCSGKDDLYSIDDTSSVGLCINCIDDSFVIKESNECVNSCNDLNLFSLGSFCYKACPNNSERIGISKVCKCKYKYYIEYIFGKELYFCLNKEEDCPSNSLSYNYETGQCSVNDCSTCIKKTEATNYGTINRCSIHCLENEYYKKIGGVDYCVDICNEIIYIDQNIPIKKKCLTDCSEIDLYKKNNKCVDLSECNFYSGSNCYDSCNEAGSNIYHKFGEKECISSCPTAPEDFIYYGDDNICYKLDSCKFVKGNKCLSSCNIGQGFYLVNDKNCYDSCNDIASPNNYLYWNYGTNVCIQECHLNGNDKKYHKVGENICYSSCKDIEEGTYIYHNKGEYKCFQGPCVSSSYPYFYSKDNGVKVCVSEEADCIGKGYTFVKNNECLKECDGYKFVTGDENLIICFSSLSECFANNKFYYHKTLKQCWSDMPSGFYINYVDNEKYEIVDICDKYYYEETEGTIHKYFCIENCKAKNLFFFNGEKKCLNSCQKGVGTEIQYYYYDPRNNECLDSCFGRTNLEFSERASDRPQPCVSQCPPDKFYFEDEKIIKPNCEPYYRDSSNPQLCVKKCKSNEKVKNNECVNSCEHIYIKDTRTETGYSYTYDKCITESECISTSSYFIDIKKKECLSSSYSNDYYVVNQIGYPKCSGTYNLIDINSYECLSSCPSGFTKLQKIPENDAFFCESNCLVNEYIYNGKCVSLAQCPDKSYIVNNNACTSSCATNSNGDHYYVLNQNSPKIYKCVSSCINDDGNFYYKASNPKECLEKCEGEFNFYVEDKNECLTKCPDEYPFYSNSVDPHKCRAISPCSGETQYFLDGLCVQKSDCKDGRKKINSQNICLDKCKEGEIKKKDSDDTFKCISINSCPFLINRDNEDDLECVEKCPKNYNFIDINQKCKKQCENDDGINYYKIDSVGVQTDTANYYEIYKCINGCRSPYNLKVEGLSQCFDICPQKYPYLSENENNCFDNCLKSKSNHFTLPGPIQICTDKCSDLYPNYGENKICKNGCGNKLEDKHGKCVEKCDYNSIYKFQDGNKCDLECRGNNGLRYSKTNYICKKYCIAPENILVGNECKDSCEEGQFIEKFTEEIEIDGITTTIEQLKCVPNCGENRYHYKNFYECLSACKGNDKVIENLNICVQDCNKEETGGIYYFLESSGTSDINKCVKKCPPNKPYVFNNKCVEECPQERNYYVKNFIHENEENSPKECLLDCTDTYPYYKIRTVETNKYYECESTCSGYYVPNLDSEKIAKLCIPSCPDSNSPHIYKYKIKNEDKCYESCPTEKPYHKEEVGSFCDINCPEDAEFHEENSYICKTFDECTTFSYIHYDTKICSNTKLCSSSQVQTVYNTYRICSSQCIPAYGKYLTPDKTCVENCENIPGKFLTNDIYNSKCRCKRLYYINEINSVITCFDDQNIFSCKSTDYKIKMFETNECTKICNNNRVLSPSEDICYPETYNCPENTHIITKNNIRKCECSYKFYKDGDNDDIQLYCLGENDPCPEEYSKYIPDTMECIKTLCPDDYKYEFNNFCLKKCPKGSTISGNSCECPNKFWYETSKGNYECLEGLCLDSYPVYAAKTKQCLKKCTGSYYPYLYDNKCYKDCSYSSDNEINAQNAIRYRIISDLADYGCKCQYPWYYDESDNNKMMCPISNTDCTSYSQNFNFMIKKTLQCVKECPYNYPYSFNNECFTSCENEAKIEYRLNVKTVEFSYECQCENLWYYIDTDRKIKECIDEEKCYLFNHEPNLNYMKERTKECVSTCPNELFKFNNVCYDKCPDGTKDIIDHENGNSCACNTDLWLWYEYEINGNINYQCGLEECPKNPITINGYMRNNLLENEKKCVESCLYDSDDTNNLYKYAFRNICIKECPSKTKTVEDKCLFYDLDDDEIDNLEKLKEAANVQAKELYEQNNHLGGYLLNKYDASLQIYLIDKLNSYQKLSMKSNLTYIDFGTCTDKIFLDNNLEDNDGIIVAKYDLLKRNERTNNGISNSGTGPGTSSGSGTGSNDAGISQSEKYLINPVEYELFSLKNNEKIDASVCDPYEIIISYPIVFNKNRFNNYENGKNKNEYKKKFEIGKELHNKNKDIDTFNSNSSVYKDICIGVEIDGKDLVLEDRYKYLYPNNVSLCESNCTIGYTDFDLERIFCTCSYKEVVDFKRIDEDKNDLLNDPNFNKPKQSGANAEILKCLSKLSVRDNEAFYYCAVITAVEVSMVFVTSFYGIKAVSSNITSLLNKNIVKKDLDIKFKKINNDNKINASNRPLNNPPKKYNSTDNEEDDDRHGNIVNKKNIELIYNNYSLESEEKNFSKEDKFDTNRLTERKKFNDLIGNNTSSKNKNYKAEFIPPEFNFKYFKITDQGIKKKIERNKIPFDVDPNTKYLLERRKDMNYDDNYLNGPFISNQNYLEIIDTNINNENNIVKYERNDKLLKTNITNYNINNKIITNGNSSNENNEIELKNRKPKKQMNIFENNYITTSDEKNYITIRKISPNKKNERKIEVQDYNQTNERYNNDDNVGLYTLIKREQAFLNLPYEKYIAKNHNNILSIFLAEILDKIYFIKICIFLKKFEIFGIHLSLYLFYHLLLLSILCGFFTVKTIKKIWEQSNFPDMNFYLLYGFLSNLIVWMIYKIFLIVLDNQDKVKELIKMKNDLKQNEEENNNEEVNEKKIKENYNSLIQQIKIKIIIFYVIVFAITIICFIYLISFFSVYTGTKSKVLKAYYISIIEIVLIKIVYGICLASLRIASKGNEMKGLFKLVHILNKYLS